MAAKYKTDFTSGVISIQLIKFMVPLALTFLLQMLFYAADIVVVGRFAENAEHAVAAVGGSSPISSLLLCLFFGLGAGVNVVVARFVGAREHKNVNRAVHTSLLLGLFCGILIMIVGFLFGRKMLQMVSVPPEVLDDANAYFMVILWGMPSLLIYNFGCAILRSAGDTKQALYFLIISGMINLALNIVLVVCFNMAVLGVAFATTFSKVISMVLILRSLHRSHGSHRFYWRNLLRPDLIILGKILYNGVPAGIQNSCFAIANLLIAEANNSFGPSALAATTLLSFAEGGLINAVSASLHQSMLSFGGQNFGAGNYRRVLYSFYWNTLFSVILGVLIGVFSYFELSVWVRWFVTDPSAEVMEFARIRAFYLLLPCTLSILQGVCTGTLRGVGYAILPSLITIFAVCIYRIWWILRIFPRYRTFGTVVITFPISYTIIIIFCLPVIFFIFRKYLGRRKHDAATQAVQG